MTDKRGPASPGPCAGAEECPALRCECGSLLARYVGGRVELKCRRCKRTLFLTVHADEDVKRV